MTLLDRLLWAWLSHVWSDWRSALAIVQPKTVIAWHRKAFRLFWMWKIRRGHPDTGERKEFFGHTPRHVITTRKEIPLEGSKSDTQGMVTDGWYIDLDTSISCGWKRLSGKPVHAFLTATATVYGKPVWNTPIEKREFVDKGQRRA